MKKLVLVSLLLAASAGMALAGAKTFSPVTISLTSRTAYGSMSTAYNSSDSSQLLNCTVYSSPTYTYGMCQAWDAAGAQVSCYAPGGSPLIAGMLALTNESWVRFDWDAYGLCTYFITGHHSMSAPKAR